MWKDFVEAFGFRFEQKEKFAKAWLFVCELQTWVEWHEKRAQQRLHLTAVAVGCLCFVAGVVIGKILEAG